MPPSLPDAAHIEVLRGISGDALRHNGTGELLLLDARVQAVQRSPAGWTIVVMEGKKVFCFHLLRRSFHEGGETNGVKWFYAYDRQSGTSAVQHEILQQKGSKVFQHTAGMHSFTAEVLRDAIVWVCGCKQSFRVAYAAF